MRSALVAVLVTLVLPISVPCAEIPLDKNGKHLFILSGQSNMRQPLPDSFRDAVINVFGRDQVIVVCRAHPSQPIKRWYKQWTPPGGGDASKEEKRGVLYDALLETVRKAIAGQPLASVTCIWMQGEADAMSGWASVYEKSFFGVLDQFKQDLGLKDIHFVLGRINDMYLNSNGVRDGDAMRAVQVKIAEGSANGDWVDTDDLNTGVNPWGIYSFADGHFPPAGYRVLGKRFARKACKLIDPGLKLDDRHFEAVFFETAADIGTHLAAGKRIRGVEPDAERGRGGAGLASLLDGRYASADHRDSQWLAFPAAPEGTGWVLDLGAPEEISQIGFNVLLDHRAGAHFPACIKVSLSEDGEDYRLIGRRGTALSISKRARELSRSDGFKARPILMLLETGPGPKARYIKIRVDNDKTWFYIDEIIVNPVPAEHEAQDGGATRGAGPSRTTRIPGS